MEKKEFVLATAATIAVGLMGNQKDNMLVTGNNEASMKKLDASFKRICQIVAEAYEEVH